MAGWKLENHASIGTRGKMPALPGWYLLFVRVMEFMQIDIPVDIVYLWVDGRDPAWRQKRAEAEDALCGRKRGSMAIYSNVEGRFRDNDELRYSLRALERFFPEHGHIYLVTDGQTPEWLANSDRLTLVDHRELIPLAALPTFDSGNIESYIHRIPNLSERYFYLNDDVFFGAPVNLDHWFWDGGIFVGWSDDPLVTNEPMREDATALENACRLSHQWLGLQSGTVKAPANASNYTPTFRTFAHSPRPMRKSALLKLEALASDLFARVRSTTFRTWDKPTIISDLVMRWSLSNGTAKIRDYSHLHVSTGETSQASGLSLLAPALGAIDFFCLNDTTDDATPCDPRLTEVRTTLQQMFPDASCYERQTPLRC
jgi:hypothetical protein